MSGSVQRLAGLAVVAALLAVSACAVTAPRAADDPVHAVYQLDGGIDRTSAALRSIRNHLQVDPRAKLTVVALGDGIDFLLQGALDRGGYPFELTVEDLAEQGVVFEACGNTLKSRGIDPARLLERVRVVPAGLAEIARLQWQLHYAYLRP